MTSGSPKVVVRVPGELLELMEDCLAGHNFFTKGAQISMSEWVRMAICEKIALQARRRKQQQATRHVTTNVRLELDE